MLSVFYDRPGLLYVVATLLPLASFVVLLLVAAVRTLLRERWPERFGGDQPAGRGAAYLATAAIAGSCVLSVIGFAMYYYSEHREEHTHVEPEVAAEREKAQQEQAERDLAERWSDRLNWAWVSPEPTGTADATPGTVLQLGYHIDSLSAIMFVMVTFIATLIHVFSIGYMGDELAPVVEDHQVHAEEGHLHRRGRFARFFLFMSLFCFSMLNLILADNLFQVFLSWELVGLCSYLLIGFYFERHSASTAANKAFITNRVGDAGFIIGMLILWTYVGTFNFEELFRAVRAPMHDLHSQPLASAARVVRGEVAEGPGKARTLTIAAGGPDVLLFPHALPDPAGRIAEGQRLRVDTPDPNRPGAEYRTMPYWLLVLAGLGIFLGCVGKSAQFPLQVWLPDAMEGPTPVSALIHAATMVAAGVYLVGRVFPLFTAESRLVIAYTGGVTLFVAATVALVMTDIKKVLAYSTVSQLGYMMLALGVGGWVAGLFHLVTHAFFKALLFLCSGSVIYGCHHEQDMLKMGGLYPKMKITAVTMLVGVLTIAGIPMLSGWYSKDAILAHALGFWYVHHEHALLFLLPLFTAGLTAFYMARMWFLTFTGRPRDEHVYEHAHESPPVMTWPLIILAICSVVVAWGWPVWDAEKSALEHQLHHAQQNAVVAEFGHIDADPLWEGPTPKAIDQNERYQAALHHGLAGGLAIGLVALAIGFAYLIYYRRAFDPAHAKAQLPALHRFLTYKWYFDEFYSATLVRPALVVAQWCRAFDARVIDGIVDGLGWLGVQTSRWDGIIDAGIVDGLVNLTADVVFAVGARLRAVQTGSLRSYVLFLALAAVAIFAALSFVFVSLAAPAR
jgi:NADH-quinone oxidoreductase subunit L